MSKHRKSSFQGLRWKFQQKVLKETGSTRCEYCGCLLDVMTITVDHLVSLAECPDKCNDENNLAASCFGCNHDKADVKAGQTFAPEKKDLPRKTKWGAEIYPIHMDKMRSLLTYLKASGKWDIKA